MYFLYSLGGVTFNQCWITLSILNCYSPNFQGFILMKNALNNQVGMLGDMFLWLVANLKQGVIYFIKQALPPNISAGSVYLWKSRWKNSITSSEIFLFNVLWSVLFPIYELLMMLRFSNDKSRSSFRKKLLFLSNQWLMITLLASTTFGVFRKIAVLLS